MNIYLIRRTVCQAPLLALYLSLPIVSSCALAQQDEQKPRPARGKGQRAGKGGKGGKRANAARANAPKPNDEANADIEVKVDPNAGQDFAIQAPMSVPIPATNIAPPTGAIFVSPDAKDTGAGTSQNAPISLDQALKVAPVGGTVVLRGGTYRTKRILLPRRLTLQAYPNEQPWLKGSIVVDNWVQDGALWRHDNWTTEFKPEGRLDRVVDPKYPMSVYGDQAYLNGKALFQVGSRAQVKSGRFFVDGPNDALYLGDNPQGKVVEATVSGVGIEVVKSATVDASGSVVRGIGFTHYARQGMAIAAPNILIENCAFVWNGNRGLVFGTGGGEAAVDSVVRGNTLVANGQAGMTVGRASRLLFEKNYVAFNNVEAFRQSWGAAGVKFFQLEGLVVRDNVVENNKGAGIWMDVNSNKATVVRNVSRFNGIGIFFEVSDQAIIAFNVCRQNNNGMLLSNSHNARVYNNTFIDNDRSVRVGQGARVNDGQEGGLPADTVVANTPPGGTFTTRGHVFKNNIFWNTRPDAKNPLFDMNISPKQPQEARRAGLMVVALSHNAYHRANQTQAAVQAWSPNGGPVEQYTTLAEFEAASSQGQSSLQTTGADPYFIDAAKEDFRLKPNSSALGKAEALPEDIAQAAGVRANIGYLGALPPA